MKFSGSMLNYQGVNWDKYPSVLIKELMEKYLGTNKIVGLKRKVNQLIEKAPYFRMDQWGMRC